MQIDNPETRAEVQAAFHRYETALTTNDIETLDALFWDSPSTIRYGTAENLYGIDQIRAFRAARSPDNLNRTLSRTTITTFGPNHATASTLFHRTPGKIGRQMQTWVKIHTEWKIVAATVSLIQA